MKFFAVCLCAVTLFFGMAATSNGAPITDPSELDESFTIYTYGFTDAPYGQEVVGDGNFLTVTNGFVVDEDYYGGLTGLDGNVYYDGGDSSVITLSFSSPASAVGMSMVSIRAADITLSLFNNVDVLLESYTIAWLDLPKGPLRYGFIGIDYGSNQIAYAEIDTPLGGTELFVDDIIYQMVPVPVSILLLGSGLIGLVGLKRKFKK